MIRTISAASFVLFGSQFIGRADPQPVAEIRKLRGVLSQQYKQLIAARAKATRPLLKIFIRESQTLHPQLELTKAKKEAALRQRS